MKNIIKKQFIFAVVAGLFVAGGSVHAMQSEAEKRRDMMVHEIVRGQIAKKQRDEEASLRLIAEMLEQDKAQEAQQRAAAENANRAAAERIANEQ